MTFLMYCVDPKDHILKVSCHYLYFWLRYECYAKCDQNIMDGETDEDGGFKGIRFFLKKTQKTMVTFGYKKILLATTFYMSNSYNYVEKL